MTDTGKPVEKAILVGVETGKQTLSMEDSLDELEQLAATAGVEVLGRITQKLNDPNRATLVGKGKVDEIRALREQLQADVVLFDEELTPTQQRNLEEVLGTKLLDRTGLILDIFARHAQTREGRLQVELAQLEYRLPRLTRMWTHLSRQAAGGVGLRGPGETQLEVDRRRSSERIAKLRDELKEVHSHRELYRQKRRREGLPIVALVGYTNAGKSTLLNALSKSDVYAANVLFATLDPTTRLIKLPEGQEVLLTDTVGFIQRLPTQLVAAFRATLEEIQDADVLLHVVDLTHPNAEEQAETVDRVLGELGITEKPKVVALNKIDRLFPELVGSARSDGADGASGLDVANISARISGEMGLGPNYVPVSARLNWGLTELLERIQQTLSDTLVGMRVLIPYNESELVSRFHARGIINSEEHTGTGTLIEGRLPKRMVRAYERYQQRNGHDPE
ncbi:MAG TPA: GTPase HflX [Chloroflexia bacterium]|jgi:GTP-binding protein HflX|nr:GTPase HflX [Chloroflexia bacterium]